MEDNIEKKLEQSSGVDIVLDVSLEGENAIAQVEINAPEKIKANLHIALVEKHVDYIGSNGINKHAFVVRHLFNDANGFTIKLHKDSASISAEVSLQDVEKNLKKYLDEFSIEPPSRFRNFAGWTERPEKLNKKNLAIVAWLQNNESHEIYQAVYRDI